MKGPRACQSLLLMPQGSHTLLSRMTSASATCTCASFTAAAAPRPDVMRSWPPPWAAAPRPSLGRSLSCLRMWAASTTATTPSNATRAHSSSSVHSSDTMGAGLARPGPCSRN